MQLEDGPQQFLVMATSERIFVDQENQAPEGVLAPKRGKLRATEGTIQRAVLGEISQNVRQPPHQLRASKPAAQVGHMSDFCPRTWVTCSVAETYWPEPNR